MGITETFYKKVVKSIPADQLDHHYSDLYIKVTEQSTDLINNYEFQENVTTFTDTDHVKWYDVPFAYQPYWDKWEEEF